LTSRRAFGSVQKEQYKELLCRSHRKISKGASTGVEEESRNFRIVEGVERKESHTDNSEDRRKKRTERKTRRVEDFKRRERYF
jgi:hypothetical protein